MLRGVYKRKLKVKDDELIALSEITRQIKSLELEMAEFKEALTALGSLNSPIQDSTPVSSNKNGKPTLVKCGRHLLNPSDVSEVRQVKSNLWVCKFKQDPNPEYPLWLREEEVGDLLKHFDVKENC